MAYLIPDEGLTPEQFNKRPGNTLPGHLKLKITHTSREKFIGEFTVEDFHMAPNGFLHAGSVVTLADSICGMATIANLPDTAKGFTTIELKTNFFSTATEGRVIATATPVHIGGATQVWDCEIISEKSGKRMALFRCTQMVLKAK